MESSSETIHNEVPRSRLEINFLRLFHQTQQMANGAKPKDWTFEKLVQWLEDTLPEMEKSPCSPSPETLKIYKRQITLLRSVLEVDKKSSTPEAVLVSGAGCAASPVDSSPNSPPTDMSQQIHTRTTAQITARLRQQLMGDIGDASTDFNENDADGYEERLANDEKRRDRLLEDMLAMTQQWKEQSKVAGKIIKKDIETLEKSGAIADTNQDRLKVEADRLAAFNQRACNCWIWLMLLLVCCVFISMVLFIKLFPKRRYSSVPEEL